MYSLSHTQSYHDGLIQKHLGYLLETGAFSDIKMLVKNGLEFNLHKVVLSLLLPESVLAKGTTGTIIRMDSMPVHIARSLILLLYTGQSMLETEDDLQTFKKIASVLKFAHKVQIVKSSDSTTKLAIEEKAVSEKSLDALIANFKEEPELQISDNPQTQAIRTPKDKSNTTFVIFPKLESIDIANNNAINIGTKEYVSSDESFEDEEDKIIKMESELSEDQDQFFGKEKESNSSLFGGLNSALPDNFLDLVEEAKERKVKTGELEGIDLGILDQVTDQEMNMLAKFQKYKLFFCTLCDNKCFRTGNGLSDHYRVMHQNHEIIKDYCFQRPFLCADCDLNFALPHSLWTHMIERHSGKEAKIICPKPKCGKPFMNRRMMIRHTRQCRMADERCKFHCPECSEKFKVLMDLADHFSKIHPSYELKNYEFDKFPYKCTNCDQGFGNARALQTHLKQHKDSTKIKFKCDIDECYKTFKTRRRKNEHIRRCHKFLKTKSVTKQRRNNHLYLKDPKNSVKCPICKESYNDRRGVLYHVRRIHKDVEFEKFKEEFDRNSAYVCTYCGKRYLKKQPFDDHAKNIHQNTDEKVPCHVCGKTFMSNGKMMGHYYIVHRYGYKQSTLKRNDGTIRASKIKVESKPAPRKLEKPERYYNLETNECKLCHKIIKNVYRKRHYLNVHDPELDKRRLSCPHCDITCKVEEALKQHIEVQHSEWKILCQVCNRKLANKHERNVHMKKAHNMMYMVLCVECKYIWKKGTRKSHSCPTQEFETIS